MDDKTLSAATPAPPRFFHDLWIEAGCVAGPTFLAFAGAQAAGRPGAARALEEYVGTVLNSPVSITAGAAMLFVLCGLAIAPARVRGKVAPRFSRAAESAAGRGMGATLAGFFSGHALYLWMNGHLLASLGSLSAAVVGVGFYMLAWIRPMLAAQLDARGDVQPALQWAGLIAHMAAAVWVLEIGTRAWLAAA